MSTSTVKKNDNNYIANPLWQAHTLIEVGEWDEATEFCNSVLRQPCKTIDGIQTQAYLTVLVAAIDKDVDKDAQLKKARKLWLRLKGWPVNSRATSGELQEISKKSTQMKWNEVMGELDETEAYFDDKIKAAKLPLEEKIEALEKELKTAKLPLESKIATLEDELKAAKSPLKSKIADLENELKAAKLLEPRNDAALIQVNRALKADKLQLENRIAVLESQLKSSTSSSEKLVKLENEMAVLEQDLVGAKGHVAELDEQLKNKQDTVDFLAAEVAILRSKPTSAYAGTMEDEKPAAPPKSATWPFSMCMGSPSDEDDFEKPEKPRPTLAQQHSTSMILDTRGLVPYSTSGQLMSMSETANEEESSPSNITNGSRLSDMEKLMMNGPILVRPGRPLAYVDDAGQIVEVALDIGDLSSTFFSHPAMASLSPNHAGNPRHNSSRF